MRKRKFKQRLKKLGKTTMLVLMLVSLNINPIAMVATVIVDSGIVSKFSNLGRNLCYLAGQRLEDVYASELAPSTTPSGPLDVNIVGTPSDYFGTTQNYLDWIMEYTGALGNTENGSSLYSMIEKLYEVGSGYSKNVKIDADSPEYKDYGDSLAVHDEALTARLLGVNERDLSHVNAAQIEQLMQMGYDPRWINENGTIEEDFDKLIRATHEYAVANVYSLNNMIGGALWRPYSDEIPYIREFAEIVGGFANVYMGYWDTNVSTLKQPINSQRALEILGYDAILRYEGIQVLEPTKILENGIEAIFVPEVVGLRKYIESPVQREIDTDPDTHLEDVPDRDLNVNGVAGVPTGQSGVNENIILRQVMVGEGGAMQYVPEDDIEQAIVPDSTIVQLYQEEIPNTDITWLDAVTVLYKALGKEQISYQTFTAYNPNITPETSPLSKDLPGLTSFDGYNFYAFFTRSNPFSGDLETGKFQAIYWRKAVNDGFVSYALRDQVISAEDFYMLAQRMMTTYGEPEMSADEMHTLLQIYGSYYPVQLGRTVADAWEYLKCRGILTEDNEPESFTSSLTRDQLLDICMRIKDKDSRITYKNMNLTIDVGEVLRDKDYFPVYDFELKTEDDDEFAFISTTVNYESYDYYTYMFPIQRAVTLGNSGCGLVYNKPDKSDENLIDMALYEGKKHIEGYDYYVIDVPKDYTGQIFLGFNNYDDPDAVNGTVDFIEVPNYCLGGGIYTAYEITEQGENKIATLVKPELGVSYFPFSSQSNNMELVYYNDIDRIKTSRPLGSESPSVASLWDKIVDKWNYLTQPMEVLAAENDPEIIEQSLDSYSNLVTKVAANSDFWVTAGEFYGEGENQVKLRDANNDTMKQVSATAPGWFSTLTRVCLLTKAHMWAWGNVSQDEIVVSDTGDAAISDVIRTDASGGGGVSVAHPAGTVGVNILQANYKKGGDLYSNMLSKQATDSYAKALIAFAAGVHPDHYKSIVSGTNGTSIHMDEDVDKALTYMYNNQAGWVSKVGNFNCVSEWSKDKDAYTKSIRAYYDSSPTGGIFNIQSRGYSEKDILDMLGAAGAAGTESGAHAATQIGDVEISASLNSSVIMNKQEQILLCWDDLVKAGYAWGLTDGKPKFSDKDNTYSFMSPNGMVKVNDVYHMIQIGTTLYTWPNDENAPNLVYVDDDKNMYFDIRCVTGVINTVITDELDKKTEILRQSYGSGSYAVYSISRKSAKTSLYSTKTLSCYNFPETPETGGAGIASGVTFPTSMNTVDVTTFDTCDVGTGKKYWDGTEDGMRVLLADFNPISNWILTVTDNDGESKGRLYVYYLKDAFMADYFVDGESPPTPSQAWRDYWEEQIEIQKKRCEANYSSVTYDVKKAMEAYRSVTDGSGYDWIGIMTEAAIYSIAADTGTFYLSEDYAVRCFDISNYHIPSQDSYTDFRENTVEPSGDDEFRTNDPGTVYFMDYAGYIYNLPKWEDFTLTDYLAGKYPIPLVNKDNKAIWNMNMTWYGETDSGTAVPYGCELTSNGYISYKDLSVQITASDLPKRDTSKTKVSDGGYDTENTNLPFYIPPNGSSAVDNKATFKPAPTAIYARYGILDSGINVTGVGVISQNETKRNYYYLGNRTVCISDDFTSRDANKIPFDFGSMVYNPIAISSTSEAHFVGQVRRPLSRNFYVLPYAKIYEVTSAITSDPQNEHLATDDSYLWDGKAKLVSVLNMIDRGTNWMMWAVFRLAPMICVIVMTILIGLSFITDNKIWLSFCEKFFDPVRILTLGMKDSNHWVWREVWRRATITYIAFALFANANFLKIIIWAVDGWMKVTEALGF